MKKAALFICIVACLLSCANNKDSGVVNIRLSNVSAFDFESIIVDTSTGNTSFGDLSAGTINEYKEFDLAYRYAFVQVMIDGEAYTLQPIDYVGETPLSGGNYTYQINVDSSESQYTRLILTLFED